MTEKKTSTSNGRRISFVKALFIAAFLFLGLWLEYEIVGILSHFFFAIVITLVLNTPTMWLVQKKIPIGIGK